jgi:hypothetical protein
VNEDSQPRFLSSKTPDFTRVVEYMGKVSKAEGIDVRYHVEGDEVVIGD